MKQAARTLGLLLLAAAIAFIIPRALPGDPAATTLLLEGAPVTPETVAEIRRRAGFDRSLPLQFGQWLSRLAVGDWGNSVRTGEPIGSGLMRRMPLSLGIGVGGLLFGAALAYMLGLAAAANVPGAETGSRALAIVTQAVPAFAAGLLFIYLAAVQLRWIKPYTGGIGEQTLIGILLVSLYVCGSLARLVRQQVLAATRMPFFVAAQSRGLSRSLALRRHAAPFGAIALVSAMRAEAGWVVGGTAVIEILLGAPGLSAWVIDSIGHRDWPVLQAYLLVIVVWIIVAHIVADSLLRRIDPRIG